MAPGRWPAPMSGEPVHLGECPRLGPEHSAVGQQRHEVVLRGAAHLGLGKGRGGLARPGEPDDEEHPGTVPQVHHLEPGVEGEPAPAVHLGVPHPDAAHLGVAEVVRVEHPRHPGLEVDRDQPLVQVASGAEVWCVDHGEFGLEPAVRREVEVLLHPGEVGVALLHDEPGRHRARRGGRRCTRRARRLRRPPGSGPGRRRHRHRPGG